MKPLGPDDTIVVRGVRLRRDPARETCFTVVHLYSELHLSLDFSAVSRREKLHREVNNETQSLEIAAQTLVDFPEAPWELRLQLARQCWDEARHAELYYQRLLEIGGHKGEFPIANHEWAVVCVHDSLPARLAIQNRSFEAGSLDSLRKAVSLMQGMGDTRGAEISDTILADETQHVRIANHWFKDMAARDPRVLLRVATAIAELKRVIGALEPRPGERSANGLDLSQRDRRVSLNTEDRHHADFTGDEVTQLTLLDTSSSPAVYRDARD